MIYNFGMWLLKRKGKLSQVGIYNNSVVSLILNKLFPPAFGKIVSI